MSRRIPRIIEKNPSFRKPEKWGQSAPHISQELTRKTETTSSIHSKRICHRELVSEVVEVLRSKSPRLTGESLPLLGWRSKGIRWCSQVLSHITGRSWNPCRASYKNWSHQGTTAAALPALEREGPKHCPGCSFRSSQHPPLATCH